MKRLVNEYESALGEMALQNQVFKKMQEFGLAREKKEFVRGYLANRLGLKGVAK
ncbi:MAG: hypothetical protein IPL26_26330 [Leptospiraceae bacterium]|nr:hypothetical protein [Leptospiraceae bacterium]